MIRIDQVTTIKVDSGIDVLKELIFAIVWHDDNDDLGGKDALLSWVDKMHYALWSNLLLPV